MNATVCDKYHLNGHTPHTLITGKPTDISDIYEFGWYKWCYYRDSAAKFPNPVKRLGIFLGPADHDGIDLSQWVMNKNVTVLLRQTLRYLNVGEINSDAEGGKI